MPPGPTSPWTSFAIDPADGLQEQIVGRLRFDILRGVLKPGAPVPSTRVLARDLGIARQLAVLAYARLAAEGYVEGRPGSATRVSAVLPEDLLHARRGKPASRFVDAPATRLSARGRVSAHLPATPARPGAAWLAGTVNLVTD